MHTTISLALQTFCILLLYQSSSVSAAKLSPPDTAPIFTLQTKMVQLNNGVISASQGAAGRSPECLDNISYWLSEVTSQVGEIVGLGIISANMQLAADEATVNQT